MDWIHNLGDPGELLLTDLILPGTHDSAAYRIDWTIDNPNSSLASIIYFGKQICCLKNHIEKWAITQNNSIYDQLVLGARFLDLRIVDINGIWYLHHEVICDTLALGLSQIKKFINETNEPIAISILPRNLSKNNVQSLTDIFCNEFTNQIWEYDRAPIREMQLSGKVVYLILDNIVDFPIPPIFRSQTTYLNLWYRTTNPYTKLRFLYTCLEKLDNRDAFVNITFTLTPSFQYLFINLLIGLFVSRSLFSLDKTMKIGLEYFVTHRDITKASTITFDYFNARVSKIIQDLNKDIVYRSRIKNMINYY
jgi:hypothetical protein